MLAIPIVPGLFTKPHSRDNSESFSGKMKKVRKGLSERERALPGEMSGQVVGDFGEYQRRMAAVSKTAALHIRNAALGFQIRHNRNMHDEQMNIRTYASSSARNSKNRLSLPLSSFPFPSLTGVPTHPIPAPHPLPSPSFNSNTNLSDESSLEASPIPSTEPEPKNYKDVFLDLQPYGRPTPGPMPFPSPQDVGREYEKIFSETSPEPSPELSPPKKPFTYAPFDYDEFEESGYEPWKAIYVFVRYLLLGH